MAGFLVGAAFGCAALYCLSLFTSAITAGRPQKAILPLLGNMASLAAGLLIAALWLRAQLMWAGIGLVGVLVGGSVALFALRAFKRR